MAPLRIPEIGRNMRTVDANSKQVVPMENLFSSAPGVRPASFPQATPSSSEALAGSAGKTANHAPHVPLGEDIGENCAEAAYAEAEEIPSWKRIIDVTCILLSLPFWL